MNKRVDILRVISFLVTIFTLLFGDNIYQQIKGHSVFSNTPQVNKIESSKEPPTATKIPNEIIDSNGVPMRHVPKGEFEMGAENGNPDEEPEHKVYLDSYYIDKYEVTNSRYKLCVDAGKCKPPFQSSSSTRPNYYGNPDFDDFPVIYVNWRAASNYCEWRGGYLPTEAQWEKAARGVDSRTYPWGEELDCRKANYCNGDTTKVGSFEFGVSPYGVHDMAGNVFEWVKDWYSSTYYGNSPNSNPEGPILGIDRVIRGSWWFGIESRLRVTYRRSAQPGTAVEYIGIRCARDAPE